jgi:hypothetical protein
MRQFPKEKETDLHMLALKAARDAGVDHYWIACSCMENPDNEASYSLHRRVCKKLTSRTDLPNK